MSDSAKGPSSGYIYQFEVALLQLIKLNKNEFLSIERVDDIAVEDSKGLYVMTIQAKHSISSTATNFGNTSKDLWKTLVLWVKKINQGILTDKNNYIAVSNSTTPKNAIIHSFGKKTFNEICSLIENIKQEQTLKLSQTTKSGKSIQFIIDQIDYVLSHKKEFKIIVDNFKLQHFKNVKGEVINHIFLNEATDEVKNNFYESLCGWLIIKCKETWLNKEETKFSKNDFDSKFNNLRDKHSLIKDIFRSKQTIQSLNKVDFNTVDYDSLYIRQIKEIERDEEDKKDIIQDAIIDYIFRDIEVAYLIKNTSSPITKYDFEEFEKKCEEKWKEVKRKIVTKNITNYTPEQLNDFAISIYDQIMLDLKIEFQDYFGFSDRNKYIQNGTFLNLSNLPKIGWHPDWKKKYIKTDE